MWHVLAAMAVADSSKTISRGFTPCALRAIPFICGATTITAREGSKYTSETGDWTRPHGRTAVRHDKRHEAKQGSNPAGVNAEEEDKRGGTKDPHQAQGL